VCGSWGVAASLRSELEEADVNAIQAWLFVGLPALVLVAALFAGRSMVRAAFGYLVLALAIAFFLLVPGDAVSAGAIGMIGFLLVAAGRGQAEVENTEDWGQRVPMRVDDEDVDEPRRV
jgi:hypothetical protein